MLDEKCETFVYVPASDGLTFVMNQNFVTGLEGTKEQFRPLYELLKKCFAEARP